MTQEEKQLLLQDLCARLPYGVKCHVPFENCTMELTGKRLNYFCFHKDVWGIDYSHEQEVVIDPLNDANNNYIVKPYLRPMSSMTEEEEREYNAALTPLGDFMFEQEELFKPIQLYKNIPFELYEFFNSYHFDYRGLIPMGLALEAPKRMYNN